MSIQKLKGGHWSPFKITELKPIFFLFKDSRLA